MYKDLITYELAEGITESHLFQVAERVLNEWMSKQPGFLAWEINKDRDGNYLDIVYWASEQDALNSQKKMTDIPNGHEWFACYKEGSIKGQNLFLLKAYPSTPNP